MEHVLSAKQSSNLSASLWNVGKITVCGQTLYINKHSALQLLTTQTHSIYVYPKVREASRTQFLITIQKCSESHLFIVKALPDTYSFKCMVHFNF